MNWLDLGYTFLGSANIIFHFIFIVTIVTQEKKKKKNIHGFKCIHAKLFFLKKKKKKMYTVHAGQVHFWW